MRSTPLRIGRAAQNDGWPAPVVPQRPHRSSTASRPPSRGPAGTPSGNTVGSDDARSRAGPPAAAWTRGCGTCATAQYPKCPVPGCSPAPARPHSRRREATLRECGDIPPYGNRRRSTCPARPRRSALGQPRARLARLREESLSLRARLARPGLTVTVTPNTVTSRRPAHHTDAAPHNRHRTLREALSSAARCASARLRRAGAPASGAAGWRIGVRCGGVRPSRSPAST